MEKKLKAIQALFALFSFNFVKEFKGSVIDKALTDEETKELLKIVGESIEQTIEDMFATCNEEKIEGDRKDA